MRHLLEQLHNRVTGLVARAAVKLVNDALGLQGLQLGVLAGETIDDAERVQNYGFSGVPLAGAEAVVVFAGGDRGHPLVVAVDDRRYRPKGLAADTVTVYNSTGAKVTITAAGDIEVTPAAGRKVYARSSGGSSGAVALNKALEDLKSTLQSWTPVANDGGAALKTKLTTLFGGITPWPVGATKLEAE